eukprot:304568_1
MSKTAENSPEWVVSLNVALLRKALQDRGLSSTGKKAVLAKRLQEALPSDANLEPKKMSVSELRNALKERNLSSKGKKAALVLRLEDALVGMYVGEAPKSKSKSKTKKKRKASGQLNVAAAKKPRKTHKVDGHAPSGCLRVHGDFNCMLNQTNITGGRNNNKFYVIQVLETSNGFVAYSRWGRVGEPGADKAQEFSDEASAIKVFEKKFRDKTKNKWCDRDNFVKHNNKYELLDMAGDHEEAELMGNDVQSALKALDDDEVERKMEPCKLDRATSSLVELLFNLDMFKSVMQSFDLDIKKMPLGAISKAQILKGFEVLEAIQKLLDQSPSGFRTKIAEKSQEFFTKIPHAYGRQRLPVLDDAETVQKKMDMLNVLGDIEIAQGLLKGSQKAKSTSTECIPHPIDVNYNSMNCDLDLVDKNSAEYQIIQKYLNNTSSGSGYRSVKSIVNVWRVERQGEDKRFAEHCDLGNRKLLWHGTNIAVVVAILKSGLRIMPHSGGRVGRGIYFASENDKSAGYVGTSADNTGIMFLNEVALGKEHHITYDDSSLRKAPSGYDSVVAQGHQDPDPKGNEVIHLNGNDVIVPAGKPKNRSKYSNSSFYQSEYLVYKESQTQIRYLLQCKFC